MRKKIDLRIDAPEIHEGWKFYKAGPSPARSAWLGANQAAAALGLARSTRQSQYSLR
jgi:hypothetical protein